MESIWPGRFDRFSFLFEKRSQVDPNVSTHLVDPNFTDLVNLQLVLLVCLLKNPRSKKINSFQLANFCWHPAEAGGWVDPTTKTKKPMWRGIILPVNSLPIEKKNNTVSPKV